MLLSFTKQKYPKSNIFIKETDFCAFLVFDHYYTIHVEQGHFDWGFVYKQPKCVVVCFPKSQDIKLKVYSGSSPSFERLFFFFIYILS